MILYRSTSINGLPLAIIVFKVLKIIKNLFKIKFLVLQFKTKKKQKQTIKRNFVTKYLHNSYIQTAYHDSLDKNLKILYLKI